MKNLYRDLGLILALACLLALGHWTQRKLFQPPALPVLSLEAFLQQQDQYEVVDARSEAEFQAGHIPGSTNLSISQAMRRRKDAQPLLAQGRSKIVVVYCDGADCNASNRVGFWLREQGYKVRLLAGGYPSWLASQRAHP